MSIKQNGPIRIAGASGSVSDRRHAMAAFAKAYPVDPVDVIISDYLSEANMTVAASRKVDSSRSMESGPDPFTATGPAFETSFLEALEPALQDLAKYNIKVVANAGASDTESLYKMVLGMIRQKNLSIKVAWVSGDEVLPKINTKMETFQNIYTGKTLSVWDFEPIYAQAYLGGLGIAEAFSQGAQIVICGRVSDASPVIGAAYWYHQWQRSQLHELANAFIAGHLIECSNYVCGGNYSGFKELEHSPGGWDDIGYPIAEISKEGNVVITKQKNSGGAVTVNTCSSQLLYEIQGPWYFNSDVTAVLNEVSFQQISQNRIALHGVRALPPPPTTKVGITARGGFQAEAMYFLTGLDIDAKARMLEAQLRKALSPFSEDYSLLSFTTIGSSGTNPANQNSATTVFRIFAQARKAELLSPQRFLRPIIDNIMQGYPGATFHLDFRQGIPRPYYEYYVTLLPQSDIEHKVHFDGKETLITSPETPGQTMLFPPRQPSQPTPSMMVDLTKFGPTEWLPLGAVVHARSGDKGPDCNCGFWVRHADEYTWLRNLLTIATIKTLLGEEYKAKKEDIHIDRFELPNLRAVHFLFRNLLDRGVTSTSSIDFLGKNVAEFLRCRYVNIPRQFLARERL